MPFRVGFLTEGHDHLILHAYLTKLLGVAEDEIQAESNEGSGHGHVSVLEAINPTLRRYYGRDLDRAGVLVTVAPRAGAPTAGRFRPCDLGGGR